ncbi:MAG: DNA double-strand break repair protein Rad50 ['Conium maculatum' witches'-broom phytoplasma]|nr:DNA double-strand break repair protein Rad50 ['Conium maculatum' witches'-broom phytoplasma]
MLENEIEGLNNMLRRAEDYKKILEKQYNELTIGEQTLFNQIKSVEQRRAAIQNNINQVNKKLEEIKAERELYQALKEKYKAMHVRMETYEKEHEASAGNMVKWGFKAFDKVTDLIPAKYGIKTLGKTTTVTRKYAQGMGKVTLILHEGHRLWHMYNEVANENKESRPMITKETLEMYTKDIDRDLDKLDADYKDQEKKLEVYNARIEEDNLTKEFGNSRELVKNIVQKRRISYKRIRKNNYRTKKQKRHT